MRKNLKVRLQQGHQVASGKSITSPYPAGTIAMQMPFFKAQGLDLSEYYQGTLNISVAPKQFSIIRADITLKDVQWAEGFNAEHFSFVFCTLDFKQITYPSLIYYPHPETKKRHFQSNHLLEILAPRIDKLDYGDELILQYDPQKLRIF